MTEAVPPQFYQVGFAGSLLPEGALIYGLFCGRLKTPDGSFLF